MEANRVRVHSSEGEPIDPPTSESREPTPVEVLASPLLTPSSEQGKIGRAWTTPRKKLQNFFPKLWSKSGV